ncbi:MAG: glucose-1-phosphate adenylyltransferase [Polyangia bacterium]|jgi:glucose-1-phosphate adenylyltransferase|nr:glucose-1-phosphate adenylyltransferase [Polyangia bacterium]
MLNNPEMMAIVMAGGEGSRLSPLTLERAKPAVPFGGIYRIIDFTLSNCIHSGLRHILLATQYRSDSLTRHVESAWNFFVPEVSGFIQCSPPQQRVANRWYAGTADSVFQNLFRIRDVSPEAVLILAGDHIYRADYGKMMRFFKERQADAVVACLSVPLAKAAKTLGVAVVDKDKRITSFQEKPEHPAPLPDNPETCLASMGIYIFDKQLLIDVLEMGPGNERDYDFGRDILPNLVAAGAHIFAWPFEDENDKPEPYWRDVGTIEGYYEANMDLVQPTPHLNLYDRRWPILSQRRFFLPPAKFVWNWHDSPPHRIGRAVDSIVSPGVIISGGLVERCVVGTEVRINSYATVTDSIIFDSVSVGRHAQIKRSIIDKDVIIPEGARIGYDLEEDRKRFTVSETGIVVIPKGYSF